MNSYPQSYPQAPVDKATRQGQSLTDKAHRSLYLKYIVFYKDINKDKNKYKNILYKSVIALLIVILTNNQTVSANAANPSIELYKLFAHMQLADDKQYRCLVLLWHKESRWSATANNPKSSAYGIPQLLKMTERDPYKQILLGLKYIKHRHKTPCLALEHHKKGWY
jgi:hypothetical protein